MGDPMEDRKKLEQLVNQLNAYQQQAEVLQQQMEGLNVTITELTIAEETLAAIKGKDNAETLVPIGAGSFLITELKNTDEVIVGFGAGIAAKKKIGDAEESIAEQKKELEGVMKNMTDNLQKITDFIVKKSPEAEALLQKVEAGESQ
ncbi:Prefoldin subunit alpha [Methanobacterium paludis]|uniref:Prefoldin subunit alpha n=2 Tax=Methanobacterium paludis (strain DSM 25820 / JCM 18151 / SWAN1) TaxID=868131 RepID=F6D5B2_METPW|nr:Prefoldin subunit alpha [Methanobacterium paludis]